MTCNEEILGGYLIFGEYSKAAKTLLSLDDHSI